MKKGILILILLILALFTVSCICAADVDDALAASEDTGEIELSHEMECTDNSLKTNEEQTVTQTDSEEKTGATDDGTFRALQRKIGSASSGDTVYLENNYSCEDSWTQVTGISISKSNLVIDGQGHTIDAKQKTKIFFICQAENVTIKNIKFINAKINSQSGGAIFWYEGANGSVSGCSFVNCSAGQDGGAIEWSHSDYGSVSGCSFVNCSAAGCGGAIDWYMSANGNISDCAFINNTASEGRAIYISRSSASLDRNWFGNTAENYKTSPNAYIDGASTDSWLFLNATVNPNPISIAETADIIFKLYLYNGSITDYTSLAKVDLTMNSNGKLDKNVTGLDEKVTFTPTSPGTGSVTATIGDVAYTTTLTVTTDGTTFWDLNNTINGNDNDTITLDRNYAFNPDVDSAFKNGISITHPVTIIGNGHTINAKKQARIFNIQSDNVILKNITFTNGQTQGSGLDGSGGAILWQGNGEVSHCTFTNNTANTAMTSDGGAIRWYVGTGRISDCIFTNNNAQNGGGAICAGDVINVFDSIFINNHATLGSAIDTIYGVVSGCLFKNNHATSYGGAIQFSLSGSVLKSVFINNTATRGIIYGGRFENSNINNNIFLNNSANKEIDYYMSPKNTDFYYNWFGNTADNCADQPATLDGISNIWLFLNATATPDTITLPGTSQIIFKLYTYFNISGVFEYDNTLLYQVNLTVTATNGNIQNTTGLDKTVTYTATTPGTGIITATIEDVGYTIELNIKANPDLSVENQVANYGENATIALNYNTTAAGKVNITLTGKKGTFNYHDLDLNVTIVLPDDIPADEYDVTVSYSGDNNFRNATATATLTVNKANSTLTINDNVTFDYNTNGSTTISYTNATGVNASVVGQPNAIVVVNDTTITVSGLNAGNYTLTVTTITDANHNNITKNATITVNKAKTQLTANAITATYNINKDLVITLKDANGNALSGVNVIVDLNGAKTLTTDKNGQVKVSTKGLAPKAYTAKVTFNGNTNYAKSTKDVKVTVKKATPKLTAKNKTFKTTTKTKKYTITLKDNTGKAIKKAKVTLKVKGKTYKATTNSKGKAVFKIKNLKKKGKYTAVIKFKGNKYYNKATKKAKIKVIVTFKTVSKGSKDKATVKEIQQALKNNGYYLTYDGHYLKIDGIYHGCTERSVREFQHDKGLKVTGKVDEKTAKKLGII